MLLVEWVVANVMAGAAFGLEVNLHRALYAATSATVDAIDVIPLIRDNVDFLACGLLFGLAQWLVLRRHVTGVRWWIPTALAGAVAGFHVAIWIGTRTAVFLLLTIWVAGLVAGTLAGVAPALIVRRHFAVPLVVFGYALAGLFTSYIWFSLFFLPTATLLSAVGDGATGGGILGLLTGLAFMLRAPSAGWDALWRSPAATP
jgi:hypothetical protein